MRVFEIGHLWGNLSTTGEGEERRGGAAEAAEAGEVGRREALEPLSSCRISRISRKSGFSGNFRIFGRVLLASLGGGSCQQEPPPFSKYSNLMRDMAILKNQL